MCITFVGTLGNRKMQKGLQPRKHRQATQQMVLMASMVKHFAKKGKFQTTAAETLAAGADFEKTRTHGNTTITNICINTMCTSIAAEHRSKQQRDKSKTNGRSLHKDDDLHIVGMSATNVALLPAANPRLVKQQHDTEHSQ